MRIESPFIAFGLSLWEARGFLFFMIFNREILRG